VPSTAILEHQTQREISFYEQPTELKKRRKPVIRKDTQRELTSEEVEELYGVYLSFIPDESCRNAELNQFPDDVIDDTIRVCKHSRQILMFFL
jgi:hypothetical protein